MAEEKIGTSHNQSSFTLLRGLGEGGWNPNRRLMIGAKVSLEVGLHKRNSRKCPLVKTTDLESAVLKVHLLLTSVANL